MAFPVVRSETSGAHTASSTSHNVTLPATVARDDALIMVVVLPTTGVANTIGWAAGWTELLDTNVTATVSGMTVGIAWKQADGTESGATATISSVETAKAATKVYSVYGAGRVFASASSFTFSAVTDPPNLNPGIGTRDYMYIAVAAQRGNQNVSAYPTSYSNLGTYKINEVYGEDATLAWGRRTVTAANENPATYTMSAAQRILAMTIAIESRGLIPGTLATNRRSRGNPHRMM